MGDTDVKSIALAAEDVAAVVDENRVGVVFAHGFSCGDFFSDAEQQMDRRQRYDHRCKIKKFGRYNEPRSVRYRRRCVNMRQLRILERVHELPDVILQHIYEHIAA